VVIALPLALLLAVLLAAPASAATVPQGPSGASFYTPAKAVPKKHGAPIWTRRLRGPAVLKSAQRNELLLYSSGDQAVSGTVAVPKGKAPKGGWPVITWAHGTVGIADRCAPSKVGTQGNYDSPLLNRWVKAGYAVVRTDYAGLGTPGPHPYLNGKSEGRSVLDMVRAARKLEPGIGKRVVIAGHSQGGQAALFAAALAPKWTPELSIRGTVAFAPVSHLGEQGALLRTLTTPSGLSGLAAMIVRGIDIAEPGLSVQALLSDQARALYPQLDEKCLNDLNKPDSFGGVAPANLFRPDANLDPVIAALSADDDPETLRIHAPVRIEQGKADTTVFPQFTDQLVGELKGRGATVTYKTYAGVDHGEVVTSAAPSADATKFVKSRF
jgi:pimeloyl-ACP methyl ester carboxylesterase